ncbi:MAG: helix-turn-helix domain-containing protein [Saprospiraceae bacterium]|nr:helix-turn-helix domain-containing protein [Saprospiraceae bacterium]MCF8252904.1 helix-turn-helix domain-containing protein [Saprospiraceae bacterium]MCF8314448.1 helix-turn-helix domain-containing protein [Saprospiraceae bacterium]MCF8443330.1 helix-turn-helix domain-containing protein [Saprospiraceae bacterium]
MFPVELNTLGDHIRKVRLERNLSQPQVAKIIEVTTDCVTYWENNRNEPRISYLPKIIEFLGYDPQINFEIESLGTQLQQYRRETGLSLKILAKQIGMDEATLKRIEGEKEVFAKTRLKVKQALTPRP